LAVVQGKPVGGRSPGRALFGKLFSRYLADPRYTVDAELSVAEVNGQPAALG
jgi:hypothetical protein